jgi:hypothetical protein
LSVTADGVAIAGSPFRISASMQAGRMMQLFRVESDATMAEMDELERLVAVMRASDDVTRVNTPQSVVGYVDESLSFVLRAVTETGAEVAADADVDVAVEMFGAARRVDALVECNDDGSFTVCRSHRRRRASTRHA